MARLFLDLTRQVFTIAFFIYAIGHSSLYALIHIEALLPRVALNIFSSLINSVVVDEKCSRFVDESFMIWQIPVYQPVSFRFRSSLRRRSRTSRRCGSTRTWASSATSGCSDIISTESTRFGWNFGFDDLRKKLFELTRFFKFLFLKMLGFLIFFSSIPELFCRDLDELCKVEFGFQFFPTTCVSFVV